MTDTDLTWRSTLDLAAMLAAGEVSAVEVLDAHLDACAARNPDLNVVVTLDVDRARAAAESVDAARVAGAALTEAFKACLA